MFTPGELNISTSSCNLTSPSGLSQFANSVKNLFEQFTNGVGCLLRFRLLEPLAQGSSAAAVIMRWEGGGFEVVENGVVHDEEPGGFWEGITLDEGWCTARDGEDGHYSVVFMAPNSSTTDGDGNQEINNSYQDIFNILLEDAVSSGAFRTTPPYTLYVVGPGDGFVAGSRFPANQLNATHTSGAVAALSYFGDESLTGLIYDSAEPDPRTNGNFLVTKTGLFRFRWSAQATTAAPTGGLAPVTGTTSLDQAGVVAFSEHTHTYTYYNTNSLINNFRWSLIPFRKPFGGTMDAYDGILYGVYVSHVAHFAEQTNRIDHEWFLLLNAGDRIVTKAIVDAGSEGLVLLFYGHLHVDYLGESAYAWTFF